MRLDNRVILILIVALTIILIPIAVFSTGTVRIIFAFLGIIFFPGYALLSALFVKQGTLGIIERIALSFGLSIALVSLIGFLLNFTPWGIRQAPILFSLAAFIIVCSAIGFIRQQLMPQHLRFGVTININWSGWNGMSRWQKVLSILGFIAVIAVVGIVLYSTVALPPKQNPTEFYILNSEGETFNYPLQVVAGDSVSLTAVIVNNEPQPTNYVVRVINSGNTISSTSTAILAPGEKWEGKINFPLNSAGPNQKIQFYLYADSNKTPYVKEPLSINIDVSK